MTEFTPEWIEEARQSITEQGVERYICIPVQLEMLDEIQRLQSNIAEFELDVKKLECINLTWMSKYTELEAEQRWKSVTEWKPKQCGFYVYENNHYHLDICYFHTEEFQDLPDVNRIFSMRIPQLPKEE